MHARFAGSRTLMVRDDQQGASFPAWVLYPTRAPSHLVAFGPYSAEVSPDAEPDEGSFPVVVISHGGGGSHLLYRDLAVELAKHGYVVVLPEHPSNNRNDNSLEDRDENLVNRPRHIRLALDAISADLQLGPCTLPGRAAVIGHSIGACTALSVAGGIPWSRTGTKIEVESDPRVKALVLLAPAAFWFVPDHALAQVVAPILIFSGNADTITPPWHAHLVLAQVPDKSQVTLRFIERAGHFSFLSPFPARMKSPTFAPSTDPEGFDRERFQPTLATEILAFLERTLRP